MTTTKTTRTVIQSSNYQANGIEDHYSPGKPMLTANSVSPRQIMDPNTSYESMRNGPAGYEIGKESFNFTSLDIMLFPFLAKFEPFPVQFLSLRLFSKTCGEEWKQSMG